LFSFFLSLDIGDKAAEKSAERSVAIALAAAALLTFRSSSESVTTPGVEGSPGAL
jgi:hypothetical protein